MKPYLLFSILRICCQKQTLDDALKKAFEAEKTYTTFKLLLFNAVMALNYAYAETY
jgi:hypothetical protein